MVGLLERMEFRIVTAVEGSGERDSPDLHAAAVPPVV